MSVSDAQLSFCTVSALRERRHTHHHLTLGKSKQEVRFLSTSSMGSSSISSETGIKHVWIDAEVGEIQMKRYPYVASRIVFLNSI